MEITLKFCNNSKLLEIKVTVIWEFVIRCVCVKSETCKTGIVPVFVFEVVL